MKRKTMILAVAALSALAFAATASLATAFETTPAISPAEEAEFPLEFFGTSEASVLYMASGRAVECKWATAEGQFDDAHTGSLKITRHGCTESILGTKCTSGGNPSGTITTETLSLHTVYLKPASEEKPHETPGVLFTPNEETGKVTEFSCVAGFVKIVLKGNGVLGTVTSPEIGGEASSSFTVNVSATEEGQQHTETVEGETYGLESNTNGGAFEPAYEQAGSAAITLAVGAEAQTTTETP